MKTTTLTQQKNYQSSITANVSAQQAFEKISRVNQWWALNFEGQASKPGDQFTVHFGETFVTFDISEAKPAEKITWRVTNCYLPWLNDKTEWTGTEIVFELSAENNATRIDMTHTGLTPELECYQSCEKGWDHFIKDSLYQLITEGIGLPQKG